MGTGEEKVIAGREKYYSKIKAEGILGKLEGFPQEAEVSAAGDMGWIWGKWIFTVQDADRNPVVSYGKYLSTWAKINGQWKMTSNIWNSNPKPEN